MDLKLTEEATQLLDGTFAALRWCHRPSRFVSDPLFAQYIPVLHLYMRLSFVQLQYRNNRRAGCIFAGSGALIIGPKTRIPARLALRVLEVNKTSTASSVVRWDRSGESPFSYRFNFFNPFFREGRLNGENGSSRDHEFGAGQRARGCNC